MTKSLSFSGGLIILPDLVCRSRGLEPSLGLGVASAVSYGLFLELSRGFRCDGVFLMGLLVTCAGWIMWLDLLDGSCGVACGVPLAPKQ